MAKQFIDSFTAEGSEKLCRRIREYWASRGYRVNVEPIERQVVGQYRNGSGTSYAYSIWGIHSDIGVQMPPRVDELAA